jgi:hypothetical protein
MSGRCVKLPKGAKSSDPGRCPKGQTWRRKQKKQYKNSRRVLSKIEDGMETRLNNHRVRRRCTDEEISDALNYCMTKFIEPVQVHIKKQDHYDLDPLSSPSTRMMIERKARMGTDCVIRALSHCGADRGQIRLLVDDYLSQELQVPNMESDYNRQGAALRAQQQAGYDNFVRNYGFGSDISSDSGSLRVQVDNDTLSRFMESLESGSK